jgi:DNA (cytosine-5)-methyltransferase 1
VICAATAQANAEICTELSPTITEAAGTSGNNKPYVICRATALANAETLNDKSATLTCYHEQPIICKAVHQNQAGEVATSDTAYTLSTASNASARNAPLVMTEAYGIAATAIGRQPNNGGNGLGVKKEISPTLTATDRHGVGGCVQPEEVHPDVSGTLCASGAGLSRPAGMASETDLCIAYCLQGSMIGRQRRSGPNGSGVNEDVSFTLNTRDQHGVAAVDCRNFRESGELSGTLQAKESGGYSLNCQNPVRAGYIVRRLLPVECERLQGYPDGWTALDENGKPISDSKRYQMLGNSVAVPCVAYILQAMAERLRVPANEQNPPEKYSG